MNRKDGVTIIELLVVIGIFAITVTFLAPVVTMIRERTHKINCANNLRRLSLSLHMYAADNNEAFPQNLGALYPNYINDEKAFDCPASKTAGTPDKPDYNYVGGLTEISPQSDVIVKDLDNNHKGQGRNILRINGSVEWVSRGEEKPR